MAVYIIVLALTLLCCAVFWYVSEAFTREGRAWFRRLWRVRLCHEPAPPEPGVEALPEALRKVPIPIGLAVGVVGWLALGSVVVWLLVQIVENA